MLLSTLVLLAVWAWAAEAGDSLALRVYNFAGAPIDVLWINVRAKNADDRYKAIVPTVRNGTDVAINTYDSHQFLIKFAKQTSGPKAVFTKNSDEEEVIDVYFDEIFGNFSIKHDYDLPPQHIDSIQQALEACNKADTQSYASCVARGAMADMKRISEAQSRINRYRDAISYRLRNYTCADESLTTTEPVETYPYKYVPSSGSSASERDYQVKIFLDMPAAKIWAVDNFLTDEECNILETTGRPKFRRATVAAEDGTSTVSEHRKAQQASYDHHQHGDREADPLWDLQQRIIALTNYHSNYSLGLDGQEGFTIIQYNPDDQYTPHCDGACEGQAHVPTGRVATAVMYCKVPDKGGATTFSKSGVYVRPKRLAATFFSYKGPDNIMDTGFTEHSGCPVLEGEKIITTFWMREGVTNEENWTMYDPSGLRILEG
eukprot:gene24473-29578_t